MNNYNFFTGYLLGWPVPNYDGFHLNLKRFHPYFVLFVELITKGCTVLKYKLIGGIYKSTI